VVRFKTWNAVIIAALASKASGVRAMKPSTSTHRETPSWLALVAALAMVAGVNVALGADPPATSQSALSKSMREQMAAMHEQAAACLRSSKSIAECRTEMVQSCRKMMSMGGQHCSMMKGGGMGMGMGMGMNGGACGQSAPAHRGDSNP